MSITKKMPAATRDWLGLKKELRPGGAFLLTALSFVLPLALWSLVSYVPFVWHPLVRVTSAGDVEYFSTGMEVPRADFERENEAPRAPNTSNPRRATASIHPTCRRRMPSRARSSPRSRRRRACPTNRGFTRASATASAQSSGVFFSRLSSACRWVSSAARTGSFARLQEPFIEFFRYLPAPAFGALCVAVLGIYDAPKIAIIFIGTFFQQVLIISNTVRRVDPALVEAAQTLGATGWRLLRGVVIPASITEVYTDMRILLGWAWTYLIVAEVVGTMSGITYFINQQARYRNFPNVYAAIAMIGIIGLADRFPAGVARQRRPFRGSACRGAPAGCSGWPTTCP